MASFKLAIVAPVFNEELVIEEFHTRTRTVLATLTNVDATLVYVVDQSTDNTIEILRRIVRTDHATKVLALSSRFGHQMSLLAGIEYAVKNSLGTDAVIMMDSDLQHPPELIPQLINEYRQGFEVVYTVRQDNSDAGFIRTALGNLFYRLLRTISKLPIHANAADFRLISHRVAVTLTQNFTERKIFLRGLFSWMGFKQKGVEFVAANRFAGTSKYSLSRMLNLATAGVLSFSARPLHAGIFIGIGFAGLAFLVMLSAVISFFIDKTIPSGWTTLVSLLMLFSGIQLIMIGVMGAYIGGIYEEVKGRPHYIIEEVIEHHE